MNLYTHKYLGKKECKIFIVFALILIITSSIAVLTGLLYLIKTKNLEWYCVLGGILCISALLWISDMACRFYGDKIADGKIIYYKFFKKYTIDISEIKVAIISARWGGYLGASGTMRKDSNPEKSMPCITLLKEISEYKGQYFYAHDIKDSEKENFLYSFNATDDILSEFFKSAFQGKIYVSDRIYNENKEFFEKLKNSLKGEQLIIYRAKAPDKETFYG